MTILSAYKMSARYIDIDGRKVRIEFNWNTVIEYLDRCAIDLNKFYALATSGGITPRHIRQLAWSGAIEGERLDGRELGFDELEFGAKLYPSQINQIMEIFGEQFTGVVTEKKKMGRVPRILFRIFR